MASATAKSYYEALQDYADEYLEETGKMEATTQEFAAWAIRTGRWEPPPNLILKKCKDDFARALREQYIKDAAGRPVRAKHVERRVEGGKQLHFWADIRRTSRKHMESSFQLRREQVVGDCRQLDRDRNYWNNAHPNEEPIQLTFDFTDDVEEGRFPTHYPPKQPR
ncbi:MAG: hypothetical protein ACYTG0_21885 [Planctomycetota bacterium]|jgi:hypothetical protein